MCSRVVIFLIGAVYIYYQVLAEDVYIAELLVESNVTLEAQTILSIFNATTGLQVENPGGVFHTVTILCNELITECLIVGDESSCNCSDGYVWSNEVCYSYNCCRETACTQNVFHVTQICIAKVKVLIYGSVESKATWDTHKTEMLTEAFEKLNGLQSLNVTHHSNTIAEFEALTSVKFKTHVLQGLLTELEADVDGEIFANTQGFVTIKAPVTAVDYNSKQLLKCTFEEATTSAGWSLSRQDEHFELKDGIVVKLDHACTTSEYKSCVTLELRQVTGIWAGTYQCGFTHGSVRHTASAQLDVALLPDVITMNIRPLTVDCSEAQPKQSVDIIATVPQSTENYKVWWSYNGGEKSNLLNTSKEAKDLVYTFKIDIRCTETRKQHNVNITFENMKGQKKSQGVDIPVIYANALFCNEEEADGDAWPKTPDGNTVYINNCSAGKVGQKERTCKGKEWLDVFYKCIKEELNNVSNAAENFLKGLGATPEGAMTIFRGLKNSYTQNSSSSSSSSDSTANINAGINILSVMARASEIILLQEDIFPDLISSTSDMLSSNWSGVNSTILHGMSSNFLQSVEHLVKNTKVNASRRFKSQNLDFQFCFSTDCNISAFGIDVNLNKSEGVMKIVAIKNLMNKLNNNFPKATITPLLISITLENNNDTSLSVRMRFPTEQQTDIPLCVFWNTTLQKWSREGCKVKTSDDNHTECVCNHLTSFSVLMAKTDISTDTLDIITYVGLCVSICSLLTFLVIEFLVWSAVVKTNLSHFRHTAMVNIAVFLFLADCSFLASTYPDSLTDTWCLVLTICKHLFFLAMFCWMLCLSAMLVHQLIFVFSPLRKRVYMFLSSILGYVCPILLVGFSFVYYKYNNESYHDEKTCWLVFERLLEGSLHAFLIPVGIVVLTNIFSMVVVIVTLVKSSVPDSSKADDKETAKSILKVMIFLTPVFGVTWVIGFFLLMMNPDDTMFPIANYSFTILNSFQGLFILLTGCFAEQKVREELLKLIMSKWRGKTESMTTLSSTTYTKDK